jgi:hypothetical protein
VPAPSTLPTIRLTRRAARERIAAGFPPSRH